MTDLLKPFKEIANRPIFVPYKLIFNIKRQKFDKIPHNGVRGLSTNEPEQWMTLAEAQAVAAEHNLDGVGVVMTGEIHRNNGGDQRLIGFDFDGVDLEKFEPPFAAYWEKSPSGNGLRAFGWVPEPWAEQFVDSLKVQVPNCEHAEVYFGTSPRFLTLTGNLFSEWRDRVDWIRPIKSMRLDGIARWRGLNKASKFVASLVAPEIVEGTAINLTALPWLSEEQQHLVTGTGQIDRSAIFHGLAIKLIDGGASQGDVLATVLETPALWQYALDHRNDDPARALQFAREEVGRAFVKSITGMRANLVGFNGPSAKIDPVSSTPTATSTTATPSTPDPTAHSWQRLTLASGATTDDDLHKVDPPWPHAVYPSRPMGNLCITGGANGIGKSTEALSQELHIATGRPYWGMPVLKGRAIFISCEDPRRIIKARMQAWLQAIPEEERPAVERDIRENFFFFGADETGGMQLTIKDFAKCVPSREAIELLVTLAQGAVSVTVETVAMLNGGDEMNTDFMQLALALKEVAQRTGASVQAIHHISKEAVGKTPTVYSLRGASSLGDALRGATIMHELSNEQMKALSITRIDGAPVMGLYNVKASYAPCHAPIYIRRVPGPRFVLANASEARAKSNERVRLSKYLQKSENQEGLSLRQLEKECTQFGIDRRSIEGVLHRMEAIGEVERVDSKEIGKKGPGHDIWRFIAPTAPTAPSQVGQ